MKEKIKMIGSSKEDLEMMEIIHKNYERCKEKAVVRKKKANKKFAIELIIKTILIAVAVGGVLYHMETICDFIAKYF